MCICKIHPTPNIGDYDIETDAFLNKEGNYYARIQKNRRTYIRR
jgi:hypothetical protein